MKLESRTPNVRISPHAHELLRQLAEEEQASMQAVLDRAIERYRRESFLRAANRDALIAIGVPADQIDAAPPCTMCDATRFYSFRRDGRETGQHVAFVTRRA